MTCEAIHPVKGLQCMLPASHKQRYHKVEVKVPTGTYIHTDVWIWADDSTFLARNTIYE